MTAFANIKVRRKKLPVVRQEQFSECGHACVAMISNYHGHKIDLFSLRAIEPTSMNGSSMLDLVRLLEKLNFTTRAIRVELDELQHVVLPAILHWNMNHFVVLKSVHKKYVLIHDPAMGERKIFFKELSNSFTGIVLEVEKGEQFFVIKAQNKLALLDLFKNIKGLKNSLIILLFLSLAIEIFILINPLFIQFVMDSVTSSNNINNLYVLILGFLILIICHTLIEYMRSNFVVYLTNRLVEYFSSGVMHHLLKIPYQYFVSHHKGDILSRFHSINEIQSKITTDSINTLLDGMVMILALIIMFIYSFKLTLVVLFVLSIYMGIRITAYRHHKQQTELSIIEHAQVNSKFLEIVQSIMSIKLYSKENTMFQSWQNHFIAAMNADIKISKVNILYNLVNILVFNIEHIAVIALGALLVVWNQFSVGMLVAFLAYRQILVNKSLSFIQRVFDYKLISVQLDRVADILLQPMEKVGNNHHINKPINGDIKVKNLSFRYAQSQNWILKDVNFHIEKGEKIAITGASGVGKTTLLKIMLGLILPSTGEVFVDDIPLLTLGLKKYRSICACVMQDDTLISGSILDNLSFMDIKIDIDRIYEVAKIAQIHEDILKMPMGYETLIGDMGSSLSGGQKQRVLLARALYKEPKLLFLDEATSHLDEATEIKINNALKQINITQIVIAHRHETIKMADRVIKLT
ncbi:ABC transporter [Legionella nautarum]|uniref:ABC transporter n=1 Tax=Legionella nautarum TaxID=45070 RepID=A0A0W0WMM1_9GAMM|nr:peptidase domain-containing ABC transporter [Legionella nautarum]KTD33575.1 ABC transporter [Legionella nautarum]